MGVYTGNNEIFALMQRLYAETLLSSKFVTEAYVLVCFYVLTYVKMPIGKDNEAPNKLVRLSCFRFVLIGFKGQ